MTLVMYEPGATRANSQGLFSERELQKLHSARAPPCLPSMQDAGPKSWPGQQSLGYTLDMLAPTKGSGTGAGVGAAVGACVRASVGALVVGAADGAAVVGAAVGDAVGASVGALVVGEAVGAAVGDVVGAVGAAMGAAVGATVGAPVGACVGVDVPTTISSSNIIIREAPGSCSRTSDPTSPHCTLNGPNVGGDVCVPPHCAHEPAGVLTDTV